MDNQHTNRGFIALISVVIVGMVLLGLSVEQSLAGWYARFNVLSAENKEQANALAEGCADQALAQLVADPAADHSDPLETVTDQGTCTVTIDTNTTPGLAYITSQGTVAGSFANLELTINLSDVHIGDPDITASSGTLVLQMLVENNDGGNADITDFDITVPGGNPSAFSGKSSQAVTFFGGGHYDVDETGPAGYLATFSGNCDDVGAGTVDIGEVHSCLLVLDDIPTTITVIANVTNNEGGTRVPSDFILKVDGTPVTQGVPFSVSPGTHAITGPAEDDDYTVSPWGYECSGSGSVNLNVSDQKTCVINYDDKPAPLECAETLMMLDRTGSMTGQALIDERTAANALIDLYDAVVPLPKIAFGVFGAIGAASPYNAQIRQTLTTDYTSLQIALISGLASASGGTNLASALDVSDRELNSSRHTSGKEKVILLLSDGDASFPSPNPDATATAAANLVKAGTGAAYKHVDGLATKIFTIHFGAAGTNNADKKFLATLASGGSTYNPATTTVSNVTTFQAPTNNTGGAWVNPTGAYAVGGSVASNTTGATRDYYQFPFGSGAAAVPVGATIDRITVNAAARSNDASGCELGVSLSWNSGTSWTTELRQPLTSATTTLTFGNTAISDWGAHPWTANEVRSAPGFRVRIRDIDPGVNCNDPAVSVVDSLTAQVAYTHSFPDEASENTDGDYFFVAPTSTDMPLVFQDIAKLACPALNPDATAPPTKGTVKVVTHVINDNTGNKNASDFSMTLDGSTFDGSESGVSKQLSPGSYSVTAESDSGYTVSKDINCSSSGLGILKVGESRTCTVTYDDKVPPPTPPDLDIVIGSWQEVPDP